MAIYVGLNGYQISVCQESIFRDDYFRRRLVQEIYPAVQALQQYIKPREFQDCLEALVNVKPNDKIKRLQKSSFTANRVPQRLDEFCKAHNIFPDIIKMDIEGFELDALKAMNNVLSKRPALDISIHSAYLEQRGQSEKEVLELLLKYGYEIIWARGGTYFMK